MIETQPTQQQSELLTLLRRNASIDDTLSDADFGRGLELIHHPTYAPDYAQCVICTGVNPDPTDYSRRAIYDTDLCQAHAHYALMTQK